jgi:hypothetical protein
MTLLLNNPQNTIALNDGDYAYQEVLFTVPKVGTDPTGLSAGPFYEFNFQTNGFGGTNGTSFSFGSPPDFDTVVSVLNAYFTGNNYPAQAMMLNGALRIVGTTRGPLSIMRLDDLFYVDKLFSDMTDFAGFGPLVDGTPLPAYHEISLAAPHLNSDSPALTAGSYTVDIVINNIQSFFTVTLTASVAYGDLPNYVNDKLTNGWVEFYRDRYIVHSHVGGDSTSVNANGFGGDTFFSSITDFVSFGVAVPGANITLLTPSVVIEPGTEVLPSFNNAGRVVIEAGRSATNGGYMSFTGGPVDPAANAGQAGWVEIIGGNGNVPGATDCDGGYVGLYGGDASGTAAGAGVEILGGGNPDGSGGGGNVELGGGSVFPGIGTGPGGNVVLNGGYSDQAAGGSVLISGGDTGTGTFGSVRITTGGLAQLEILGDGSWLLQGSAGTAGQALTSQGTGTPPSWSPLPYDIACAVSGAPAASAIVLNHAAVRNFEMDDDLAGSVAEAQVAATASTVFSVERNGVQFATITFGIASTTGTFVTAGAGLETFAPLDIITIVAPGTPDATLADIAITLYGWMA